MSEVEVEEFVDVDRHLTGRIYRVPDKFWGFEAAGRVEHPGACIFSFADENAVLLCKGTDIGSQTAGYMKAPYFVMPDEHNRLTKKTAFELVPRRFRLRRVLLMDESRHTGTLGAVDLKTMQDELMRIFASEEGQEGRG